MRRALVCAIAALAAGLTAPALAQPLPGEVQEIIIKVVTEDGVKWYRLGKDLQPVDIKAGDQVQFDYADDTVEEIEVELQPSPEGAQSTSQ
jgi:predicted DNA-binding antitoxin AbrB/MazE fold protein